MLIYTLKVKGQSPNDVMSSTSTNTSITMNNLTQDTNYTFRIVAMNALCFGFASSNEKRICKFKERERERKRRRKKGRVRWTKNIIILILQLSVCESVSP